MVFVGFSGVLPVVFCNRRRVPPQDHIGSFSKLGSHLRATNYKVPEKAAIVLGRTRLESETKRRKALDSLELVGAQRELWPHRFLRQEVYGYAALVHSLWF